MLKLKDSNNRSDSILFLSGLDAFERAFIGFKIQDSMITLSRKSDAEQGKVEIAKQAELEHKWKE